MRRGMALLLGLAVGSLSSTVGWHVHAYAGHDHPDHHHGAALHAHNVINSDRRHDDNTARLDACDPARHLLAFVLTCGAVPESASLAADVASPAVALVDLRSHPIAAIVDPRVHGPPRSTPASPRAPPLTPSA